MRDDVFQLLLSLPVVFCSASIFFDGAVPALRAKTLDMMVPVAVAVGGRIYSLVVTLTGGDEVFYEAATKTSLVIDPVGVVLMSVSTTAVALNAQLLRRLDL